MSTPLFSTEDKAAFSDVSFQINEYLHHLNHFDRVEDVVSHLEDLKKHMKRGANAINDLFDHQNKDTLEAIENSNLSYLTIGFDIQEILNKSRERKQSELPSNLIDKIRVLKAELLSQNIKDEIQLWSRIFDVKKDQQDEVNSSINELIKSTEVLESSLESENSNKEDISEKVKFFEHCLKSLIELVLRPYKDKCCNEIDVVLKKNVSLEDHLVKVFEVLQSIEFRGLNLSIQFLSRDTLFEQLQKIDSGIKNPVVKQFIDSIKIVRETRFNVIPILNIIKDKLKKLQNERNAYQELLLKDIRERNRRVKHLSEVADSAVYYFRKLNGKLQSRRTIEVRNQYFIDIIDNLGKLYSSINDLNIERNKMRGLLLYYPAFRKELFNRRSHEVRQPQSEEELRNLRDGYNSKRSKFYGLFEYQFFDDSDSKYSLKTIGKKYPALSKLIQNETVRNEGDYDYDIARPTLTKETKILLRALRILNNIKEDKQALEHLIHGIEDVKLQLIKQTIYNEEDPSRDIDRKIDWQFIAPRLSRLYRIDRNSLSNDFNQEIEYNQKIEYEYNWQINDKLEEANFIWLINHIKDVENEMYQTIVQNFPVHKRDVSNNTKSTKGRVTELTNQNQDEENRIEFEIKHNEEPFRTFQEKNRYIIQEITYFIYCAKGNLKRFNDRVNARVPTTYSPHRVENQTFRNLFPKYNYELSSKFRNIITHLGHYLEKSYNTAFVHSDFNNFDDLVKYVEITLEELRIGQYSLISQYLHSNEFASVTDKIQIYGGAFGIYDYEARQLIRIQDRRYSEEKYRPDPKDIHSKWYDLPERIMGADGLWNANPFEESIDLMFLAQSLQEKNPFFYENLTKDRNFLNDVERTHNCLFCEDGEISAFTLLYRLMSAFCNSQFRLKLDIKKDENLKQGERLRKLAYLDQNEYMPFEKYIEEFDYDTLFGKTFESTSSLFSEPTRSDILNSLIGLRYPDIYLSEVLFNEYNIFNDKEDLRRFIGQIPTIGDIILKLPKLIPSFSKIGTISNILYGFLWFSFFYKLFEDNVYRKKLKDEGFDFLNENLDKLNKDETINILEVIIEIQIKLRLCEKYIHSSFFRENTLRMLEDCWKEDYAVFLGKNILDNRIAIINREINRLIKERKNEILFSGKGPQTTDSPSPLDKLEKAKSKLENKYLPINEIKRILQKKSKDFSSDTDYSVSFEKTIGEFIVIYKSYLKFLLKNIFKGIIYNENEDLTIQFQKKEISEKLVDLAYNKVEGLARIDKFYSDRDERVNKEKKQTNISSFLMDLHIQGLVHFDQGTLSNLSSNSLITISERYINLSKFIQKELNPDKKSLKLRCDYPPKYYSDINTEKFFIDKQLRKLEIAINNIKEDIGNIQDKLSDTNNKDILNEKLQRLKVEKNTLEFEFGMRQSFLTKVEQNLQPIAGSIYEATKSLKVSEIEEQLSSILTLLFEAVQPLYSAFGRQNGFLTTFKEINKDSSKNGNKRLFELAKKYIGRLARFDIPANFIWRANSHHAFSQLTLPLASTSIVPKEESAVGFLILGLRNVAKDTSGNYVHITHETERFLRELIFTIRELYQPLVHPYMDVIFHRGIANESVLKNAIRAGVSRIMARNLAHNIGSHVLSNLAGQLLNYKLWIIDAFIRYLRDRMSFIADVSLGAPSSNNYVSFKDSVMDKFIPKSKAKTKPLHEDIDTEFQLILLDYISGSPTHDWSKNKVKYVEGKLDLVSLPNDQFGAHAIFIILENFMRNAFKHGKVESLELTVKLEETKKYKEFYKIIITDNLGEEDRDNSLPNELNKRIRRTILDKRRILRTRDWGFLEMKIAAAYLREIDPVEIDQYIINKKRDQPSLIELSYDKDKNLQIEFYVLKTREIEIVVDDDNYSAIKEKIESFENNEGILISKLSTRKEKEQNQDNKYLPYKKTKYKVLLYLTQESGTISILGHLQHHNSRVVLVDKYSPKNDWLSSKEELLKFVWEKRCNRLLSYIQTYNQTDLKLNIDDILVLQHDKNDLEGDRGRYTGKIDALKCIFTDTILKESCNSPIILYDDHGGSKNLMFLSDYKDSTIYREHYKSAHPTTSLMENIESMTSTDEKHILKLELLEACLSKVLVLDERIQTEIDKSEGGFGLYEDMHILVPTKSQIDLSNQYIQGDAKDFSEVMKSWIISCNQKDEKVKFYCPISFIVIHITLIEKILGNRDDTAIRVFCNELIADLQNEQDQSEQVTIVLTSGRGTPSNRPKDIPFLAFSTLARYTLEDESRSKYELIKNLYSASMSSIE